MCYSLILVTRLCRLLKGAWHVNGWYIGLGWKVHVMVHGKWINMYGFLNTPLGIRKVFVKMEGLPGLRLWNVNNRVSCNPKVTHIALPPNMDSSSFAHHHKWQAGLSQMGAKTDMTLFLANTMHFCTKL